jgi:hypothetical protein
MTAAPAGDPGDPRTAGSAARAGDRRYPHRVTSPDRPTPVRPVEYKGEPLDAERGPGLGCFRFQVALLAILVVLTPLTVAWGWPAEISAVLLLVTLVLLLFAGQTIIFLLRLVAADRREGARHAPRTPSTPTVGQLEDEGPGDEPGDPTSDPPVDPRPADPGVRE